MVFPRKDYTARWSFLITAPLPRQPSRRGTCPPRWRQRACRHRRPRRRPFPSVHPHRHTSCRHLRLTCDRSTTRYVSKPASQLFPLALALAPAPAAWTVDCRLKIHGSSVQSVWIRLTLSSLLFQRSAVFLSTFPWKFSACPARSLPLYSSPSVKPRMVAKDYVSLSPPVSAPVRCQEQSISPANPSV